MKEIVIPQERAVFRLDGNGCWCNKHGRFRNRKIIKHFNASIERDAGGYYVTQVNGDFREKVYFPYEDTALFAVEIVREQPVRLILNTGSEVLVVPGNLFVKGDSLYMQNGDERIKFNERTLLKIADMIEYENEQYYFRDDTGKHEIRTIH